MTTSPLRIAWSRAEPGPDPAMSNAEDRHRRIRLARHAVEVDGRPAVPVSGELHYSRVPREAWDERLRLLRSGGVTVVATYVLWNHHEPVRGRASFDGGLDLAAFVRLAADVGLDVVVRIGPWAHGESRYGGFPDWVAEAPVAHRTDDAAYLALVGEWYGRIGEQLGPLCGPDSAIIGIQLENELIDRPGHLVTLKRLAREAGLSAPIWTATAWDGARLPKDVVMPVFGGYADGFWVGADEGWHPDFRTQFLFSHEWDSPGVGADVRGAADAVGSAPSGRDVVESVSHTDTFPLATCELGGGMASAYHRRPVLAAADLAAVSAVKIGSGSVWQGFYMYAGGRNPRRGLQESQDTGYPNDLPEFDYDFHAPVGSAGLVNATHAALRLQHAAFEAFGDRIAAMSSSLPERMPASADDEGTLRFALRSDGEEGLLVVVRRRPYGALPAAEDVRFRVDLEHESVVLPSAPVSIPDGTVALWPVGLRVAGTRIRWATASVVTLLGGDDDAVLVLAEEAGVPVEVATADGVRDVAPGGTVRVSEGLGVHVIPAADRPRVWPLGSGDDRRLLRVVSDDAEDAALWLTATGGVAARSSGDVRVEELSPKDGAWRSLALDPAGTPRRASVEAAELSPAGAVPSSYGERGGRASAPSRETVLRLGAAWALRGLGGRRDGVRRVLEIEWAGDVAVLEHDGRVVADRFWDGTPWSVDLDDAGIADEATLRVLPLRPDAAVFVPPGAEERRRATSAPLCALDRAVLHERALLTAPGS